MRLQHVHARDHDTGGNLYKLLIINYSYEYYTRLHGKRGRARNIAQYHNHKNILVPPYA